MKQQRSCGRSHAVCRLVVWTCMAAVSSAATADEVRRVVAGEGYRAGGLHRFLWGADYRDLWTTPLELPVLDMGSFGGGLTPTRIVGHGQSRGLALKGGDGRSYTFRPLRKDPTGLLPEELQDTVAARLVQDQMASQHPAAHVMVPPLMAAVGGLRNEPRLVILPDDPALGEFREEFKGLVGDIEEFSGSPGFGGALETIGGEEMWKRLDQGPDVRPDSRSYLAARLVDHLIGDWDRHRNQWRWAKMPDKPLWQPIPEDRDQAFVRFEGAAIAFARPMLPLLVKFGPEYSSLHGLTYDGWDVDRRILADLDKAAWDEVAAMVKARTTDQVIEQAARRMPPEYFERDGARLIAGLKSRRDELTQHADRFYRFMAEQVDVRGTHAAERAEIVYAENGDVELSLSDAAPEKAPWYRRRFRRGETREVVVRLLGGPDRVVSQGVRRGGITVRVVGGDGADVLDESNGGGTRFYGPAREDKVAEGPGTHWDRKAYTPPPPPARGSWIPAREWGRRTIWLNRVIWSSDLGLFVSSGLSSTGYGFRKHPWADQQAASIGFAVKPERFRAQYTGRFRLENSRLSLGLHARGSGIDVLRYHGFGNETALSSDDSDFYKVESRQLVLRPGLLVELGKDADLTFGPIVKFVRTPLSGDRLIGSEQPYGSDRFGTAGAVADLVVDKTGGFALPRRGLLFTAGGSFYPALWDAEEAFGDVHAEATTFLGVSSRRGPVLTLRAGGKQVFGRYPYYESAYIGGGSAIGIGRAAGGGSAVRGLDPQRYAGDASLYGSAELHLPFTRVFLLVPGEIGVMGVADTGRVFLETEESKKWHRGFGGGLWFGSPNRRNLLELIVASSEGRTAFYIRAGLWF